ncbi:hypothetical protein E9993_11385 [Labilibacter sediminis]|nr:hypothetical protein E9993_11385 [Labilibacter sediminis]
MKKSLKILYWLPRCICIAAILFISLFALDVFASGQGFWIQIRDFIIHLIPSFVLLIVLLIAWKWEFAGGVIFCLLGLGLTPFVFMLNYRMNNSIWMSLSIISMITLPFVLVGVLFIVGHFKKQKLSRLQH